MYTCDCSAVKLEVESPEWSAWRSQALVKESAEAVHMTNEVQEPRTSNFQPAGGMQKHDSGTRTSPAALRYITLQRVTH